MSYDPKTIGQTLSETTERMLAALVSESQADTGTPTPSATFDSSRAESPPDNEKGEQAPHVQATGTSSPECHPAILAVSTGATPAIIYNQCPIINAPDFCANPIPPPPEVVKGLLREGHIGMMAASSKAGKSWAVLSLCLAVASGKMWFGFDTTAGRVLYINAELTNYDLQSRLKALCGQMGLDGIPDNLDVMDIRGGWQSIARLTMPILKRQEAVGKQYTLICPDPLYAFNRDDENDNSAMSTFMGTLATLSKETGAAVWMTHHFSKGNKSNTDHLDRGSGAGAMARAVDCYMTLTRHKEENAYTVELSVRSFPTPSSFVAVWEYPVWRVNLELDPDDLKQANGRKRKKKATADEIVALLVSGGKTFSQWQKDCAETFNIEKSQFNRLRKVAELKKLVVFRDGIYLQASNDSKIGAKIEAGIMEQLEGTLNGLE